MLILITYDVNTQNIQGVKRLSKVAKVCTNYGRRVQNSVFECLVDSTKFAMIKKQLSDIIDSKTDSIRFYILGDKFSNKIENIGIEKSYDITDTLLF